MPESSLSSRLAGLLRAAVKTERRRHPVPGQCGSRTCPCRDATGTCARCGVRDAVEHGLCAECNTALDVEFGPVAESGAGDD